MFFKRKKISSCNDWIDSILEKFIFQGIQSINFNIYEGENTLHLQIIGSESTPEQDEEWYCDNHFTTGENVFIIDRKITGGKWEEGLQYFINVVNEYLENGKNRDILKNMKAVGIGFVDGDNEILYRS